MNYAEKFQGYAKELRGPCGPLLAGEKEKNAAAQLLNGKIMGKIFLFFYKGSNNLIISYKMRWILLNFESK